MIHVQEIVRKAITLVVGHSIIIITIGKLIKINIYVLLFVYLCIDVIVLYGSDNSYLDNLKMRAKSEKSKKSNQIILVFTFHYCCIQYHF